MNINNINVFFEEIKVGTPKENLLWDFYNTDNNTTPFLAKKYGFSIYKANEIIEMSLIKKKNYDFINQFSKRK